jgi:hypothetical protein
MRPVIGTGENIEFNDTMVGMCFDICIGGLLVYEFIVMPNHIHSIIEITSTRALPTQDDVDRLLPQVAKLSPTNQ